MSATPMAGAYLANGTIGNVGLPGAPIVHFALVVVPGQHSVSGSVQITQAVENGNYRGRVEGTIYATGYGNYTQVVAVRGLISPIGPMPLEIPFEAYLAIDNSWNGVGGFNYGSVHLADVPVKAS